MHGCIKSRAGYAQKNIPLQQGLKLQLERPMPSLMLTQKNIPLQQGLKLDAVKPETTAVSACSEEHSTTTRIETGWRGLCRAERKACSEEHSTTTRIETPFLWLCGGIRATQKNIPLQQGLKLRHGSDLHIFGHPQKNIPLQQGLKLVSQCMLARFVVGLRRTFHYNKD